MINNAIALSLSRDRLDKYLNASGSDLDLAIGLYERNTRLAESFYTPLQALEICLRNHLDAQLIATYGADWTTNGAPPLAAWAIKTINEVVSDLKTGKATVTAGDIVAELHFGFWLSLLGQQYDNTLWRTACYRAFQDRNGKRLKRKTVHNRLNVIRRFRNRIAHHEPIFQANLQQAHGEILETCGWMCVHTAAWAQHHSRFPAVLAAP